MAFLDFVPIDRVGAIHVAGGRVVGPAGHRDGGRVLDDHLHPVPDAVYMLLTEIAARSSRPLSVILERDGAFEGIEPLLAELDRARIAVSEGRSARVLARI